MYILSSKDKHLCVKTLSIVDSGMNLKIVSIFEIIDAQHWWVESFNLHWKCQGCPFDVIIKLIASEKHPEHILDPSLEMETVDEEDLLATTDGIDSEDDDDILA